MAGAVLAVPVETVLLLTLIDRTAEKPLEHLEIDLALGEGFGKQRLELLDVRGDNIGVFDSGSLRVIVFMRISA